MKKLEKLKLNYLSKNSLDERQQNALKGGAEVCNCSCANCSCPAWDGSGSMPVNQSGNDMGMGSTNKSSAGMRDSYL